eukprot:gnl/TRDRNA2_/TRDRNA2_44374_c0_seq1.p1 gnl/TRDRNA2_/TRDRNA2_44374_c0~~gnl/TRDRNA2_/TRDRNA2_44374_c0_seq1.p1  ORF type:complete len:307 (-),score=61.63 gnl/TRDRNA2_/TRDRNA2_44374_c0_seq1:48-935(-)
MDLAGFVEEVLDATANICGDTVVESQEQAGHVLEALLRRQGVDRREVAAVFGVSLEQLARCQSASRDVETDVPLGKNELMWNLSQADAVYTLNVLIQRINQAAHWREEFRDLQQTDDEDDGGDQDGLDTDVEGSVAESMGKDSDTASMASHVGDKGECASAKTRAKARMLLAKHLDAPEPLRRHLVNRLEDEIFEACPGSKDYTIGARAIAANFRRNTMLAANYATGRVPPQWIVLADIAALAPRLTQLRRRVFHAECRKDVKEDDATAQLRQHMIMAGRGTNLAPPPDDKDPFG